jgi:hypothetical protein
MAGTAGALGSIVAKLIALYRREPAATQTAAAVVWAGWTVIDNAFIRHTGVFSWQIVVAAVIAAYGLLVRAQVIPVAKPPAPVPAPAPPPAHT